MKKITKTQRLKEIRALRRELRLLDKRCRAYRSWVTDQRNIYEDLDRKAASAKERLLELEAEWSDTIQGWLNTHDLIKKLEARLRRA